MNKHLTNITLAILLIIIPALGFPSSWKSFFVIIAALIIGINSFNLYRKEMAKQPKPRSEQAKSTTFVDNLDSHKPGV